jgi:hypothetical protein
VGYWRLFRPLEVMRRLYPGVFFLTYKIKELTYADLIEHDMVIARRPTSNPEQAAVLLKTLKKARELGRPVVFDEDDHVLACPDTHELYPVYSKKEVRQDYVTALQMASAFWFSTPAFLTTISQHGEVIPNAILPEDIRPEPAPDMGLFGWQGKSIQAHDLLLAGRDWYEKNKHSPLIKNWVFFGWKPPLEHLDNVTVIPPIGDVDIYMASFTAQPINGMWKPLIDCAFNDHKSNINFLGATMAGGYCITNYAGRPGWEFASAELLPYDDACELWAKAREYVIEKHNLYNTARQRAQSIFRLLPGFFPEQKKDVKHKSNEKN